MLDLPDNDPSRLAPIVRVVFAGKMQSATAVELFSVPISGGTRTTLSGSITPGGKCTDQFGLGTHFAISPDSARVVFLGDLATAGVTELFSVPITGGARTTLSGLIVPGGNVFDFLISGNGSNRRRLFRAILSTDNRDELFSVPITGGTRNRPVWCWCRAVACIACHRAQQRHRDLWRKYPGRAPPKSSAYRLAAAHVPPFRAASYPAERVPPALANFSSAPTVFRVVVPATTRARRWPSCSACRSAAATCATPSQGIIAGGDLIDDFEITADSTRAWSFCGTAADGGRLRRLLQHTDWRGSRTLLSGTTVAGSAGTGGFLLSPDGARVVFVGDLQTVGKNALYAVPAGGYATACRQHDRRRGRHGWPSRSVPTIASAIFAGDVQTAGGTNCPRAAGPIAPLTLTATTGAPTLTSCCSRAISRAFAALHSRRAHSSGSATITDPTAIANAIAAIPSLAPRRSRARHRQRQPENCLPPTRCCLCATNSACATRPRQRRALGTGAAITLPATIESRIQTVLMAIQ